MEKKGWKKCKIRKLNYLISILIYCIDINISLCLIYIYIFFFFFKGKFSIKRKEKLLNKMSDIDDEVVQHELCKIKCNTLIIIHSIDVCKTFHGLLFSSHLWLLTYKHLSLMFW